MRIALIDPSLFTLPYDAALAAALISHGHDVALHGRPLRHDDGSLDHARVLPSFYRIAESAAVRVLPGPLRLGIKGVDHAVSMAVLRARFKRERPDVIHFQWLPLPWLDRRFLADLRSIAPLVMTVHDSNPFNGHASSGLQRLGLAAAFAHFGRVIVHTDQGRRRLLAQGVSRDRIVMLPHGLLGAVPAHPRDSDPMSGELEFLLFGKLKPYKGIDLLIEAYARLPAPLRAQARVRVIGKPYIDLEPFTALACALGVQERVTIEPRFVADEEIGDLFRPGVIAAFPYREIEASGVLTLAIAHGRPILATKLGGFAECIETGIHGLLAPPGDSGALADAMARFISDRRFAAGCARRVRELAGTMPAWADIAARTVDIYHAAATQY